MHRAVLLLLLILLPFGLVDVRGEPEVIWKMRIDTSPEMRGIYSYFLIPKEDGALLSLRISHAPPLFAILNMSSAYDYQLDFVKQNRVIEVLRSTTPILITDAGTNTYLLTNNNGTLKLIEWSVSGRNRTVYSNKSRLYPIGLTRLGNSLVMLLSETGEGSEVTTHVVAVTTDGKIKWHRKLEIYAFDIKSNYDMVAVRGLDKEGIPLLIFNGEGEKVYSSNYSLGFTFDSKHAYVFDLKIPANETRRWGWRCIDPEGLLVRVGKSGDRQILQRYRVMLSGGSCTGLIAEVVNAFVRMFLGWIAGYDYYSLALAVRSIAPTVGLWVTHRGILVSPKPGVSGLSVALLKGDNVTATSLVSIDGKLVWWRDDLKLMNITSRGDDVYGVAVSAMRLGIVTFSLPDGSRIWENWETGILGTYLPARWEIALSSVLGTAANQSVPGEVLDMLMECYEGPYLTPDGSKIITEFLDYEHLDYHILIMSTDDGEVLDKIHGSFDFATRPRISPDGLTLFVTWSDNYGVAKMRIAEFRGFGAAIFGIVLIGLVAASVWYLRRAGRL